MGAPAPTRPSAASTLIVKRCRSALTVCGHDTETGARQRRLRAASRGRVVSGSRGRRGPFGCLGQGRAGRRPCGAPRRRLLSPARGGRFGVSSFSWRRASGVPGRHQGRRGAAARRRGRGARHRAARPLSALFRRVCVLRRHVCIWCVARSLRGSGRLLLLLMFFCLWNRSRDVQPSRLSAEAPCIAGDCSGFSSLLRSLVYLHLGALTSQGQARGKQFPLLGRRASRRAEPHGFRLHIHTSFLVFTKYKKTRSSIVRLAGSRSRCMYSASQSATPNRAIISPCTSGRRPGQCSTRSREASETRARRSRSGQRGGGLACAAQRPRERQFTGEPFPAGQRALCPGGEPDRRIQDVLRTLD